MISIFGHPFFMRQKTTATVFNYLNMIVSTIFLITSIIGILTSGLILGAWSIFFYILVIIPFGGSVWNTILFRRFLKRYYFKSYITKNLTAFLKGTRVAVWILVIMCILAVLFTVYNLIQMSNRDEISIKYTYIVPAVYTAMFVIYLVCALLQTTLLKKSNQYIKDLESAF